MPLLGLLYVRANDIANIPQQYGWQFCTKLELARNAVLRFAELVKTAGKALWVAADGAYAKRPFLKPLRQAGITVVSRLRKYAAPRSVPAIPKTKRLPVRCTQTERRRPRKYGTQRIHMARRDAHPGGWQQVAYLVDGQMATKTIKTFLPRTGRSTCLRATHRQAA